MVMFFNWVDLWVTVTIILPFTPAGWRTRLDSLRRRGDRGARRGTHQSPACSEEGHDAKERQAFGMKTSKAEKDRGE